MTTPDRIAELEAERERLLSLQPLTDEERRQHSTALTRNGRLLQALQTEADRAPMKVLRREVAKPS